MPVLDVAAGPVLRIHFSLHHESHLVFPRCFAVAITWHTWWYLGTNWVKVTLIKVYWNWRTSTIKVPTYWRKHRRKAERLGTRWTQDVPGNTAVLSLRVANTWNYRPRTEIAWDRQANQYSGKTNIRKCTKLLLFLYSKITDFSLSDKQKFRNIFLYTIWMRTCWWGTETLFWL